MGKINQIESTWKMVIKLDIAAMDHRHEQLRNYMAQTRAPCYDKPLQIKMKETCHNLLEIAEKAENKQKNC
ncbi:hypothetical protein ACS0PU_005335 [Formica fusca]